MSDRMDWLFGKPATSTDNAQSARMQWLTETPDAARQEEKNTTAVVAPSVGSADSSPKGGASPLSQPAPTAPLTQGSLAGTGRSVEQVQQEKPLAAADYDRLMSEAETRLAELENEWRYKNNYSYEEKQAYLEEKNALEQQIEASKAGIWRLEKREKYGGLKDNADFYTLSTKVADEPTAGFGIGFGISWFGKGDPVYDYINNIDGTREKAINPSTMGHSPYSIYDYMDKDEIEIYNYLYNTDGEEAAKEYLDYIEYGLNAKRTQKVAESAAITAGKAPVLSSIVSVPANIVSGMGLLDVIGQNLYRDISGEYRPIDYNRGAMSPSVMTSAIRGTVAQNIADSTGVINLDGNEHPVLSKVFNGKSLGDVYQLGMSVADSLTVAYLTPFGKYGAVLLGGSAGTQGVLDALERGATDEQALRMGLLNGTFEALFEYVSLDKLLTSEPRKLVMALLRQGGVEASEEAATTLANNVADILVMAEKSDYQLKIQAYMESGMSREEATKQALLDKCIELGWDAVGGFFSGGLSGGFSAAVSGSSTHRTAPVQTETQTQARAEEQLLAEAQDWAPQLTIEEGPAGVSPAVKPLNQGQQTEEAEQNIAVLRSAEERDTVEEKNRRIARAVELASQGKTPSQIFQETGLVTKANGDITDGFGGEVIWRNNGQQRISDRGTAEIKTEGKTQTEVPSNDGRGDAGGLLSQTGRSSYASLTEQQRDRTREAIILRLREANREESFILLEEYGDDAELAQEIYNDFAAGDVALERWAEFFGDTEGLARELDEIISPLTQQKGSPFGESLSEARNLRFRQAELTPEVVERSETEGGNSAVEPTTETDPAEAAVEQEYRRLVGNAITEGDYQRALALYREYNNPALRAYKEFYTLKTFSEYAASQGYIPATDTALGTEEALAAFEESYRNAVEDSNMDGTAFIPARTLEEAQEFANEVLGLKRTAAYSEGLTIEFANGLNEAIYKINKVFNNLTKTGYLDNIMLVESRIGEYASYSLRQAAVNFNVSLVKLKNVVAQMAQDAIEEFENGSWSTGSPFHSIYHELGHVVQHMILDNDAITQRKIDMLYDQIFFDIMGTDVWSKDNMEIIKKGCAGAKEIGFCYYGLKDSGEFVAESIAQFFISDNPSEIAKNVIIILKGGG